MSGLNRLPTRSDYTEEAVWARLSPVVLNDNAIMVVYVRDEFHDREELTRAIRALADYRGQELRLVGFRTTLGCDQHEQHRALAGLKRCRWIMTVMTPRFSDTPDTRYFLEYMHYKCDSERWMPVKVCEPRRPLVLRRIDPLGPHL